MGLFKNILLTLDCSAIDRVIVDHVSKLAKIHNSKVFLFHVVHSHTLDQDRILLERAQKCLHTHETFLKNNNIDVNTIIKNGEPEKVILAEIEAGPYDLVAMATHGHGPILDFILGSVSDSIKHRINIPILMIKSN